jgi:hypothetical protein
VLAALVEKSMLTPQYYPMTVNALMLAANQKTVRNPVMNLSEGETGAALNTLERLRLAQRDSSSSRALKWRHQMQHQMLLGRRRGFAGGAELAARPRPAAGDGVAARRRAEGVAAGAPAVRRAAARRRTAGAGCFRHGGAGAGAVFGRA